MDNPGLKKISDLLENGVKERVFPGAVLLVAAGKQILLIKEAGTLSTAGSPEKVSKKSIYDIASLTKPMAAALALMGLTDKGIISLDRPVTELVPLPGGGNKKDITPRLLLNHSAGLPAWKPYYPELVKYPPERRKHALRNMIMKEELIYPPGKGSLYSDLGFMMLEWIIENCSGKTMEKYLTDEYYNPLGLEDTFFCHREAPVIKKNIAATEDCPWRKRIIQGEVHDENAFASGGYSGHAGLFSNIYDLFKIADMLRNHYNSNRSDLFKPETVREFFRKQDIAAGSTWALGWDTPSAEGSSSGKYFSKNSVGHLGFTGTSIWMDLDREILVILLSNRVHLSRENIKIRSFRPELHNTVMEAITDVKQKPDSV